MSNEKEIREYLINLIHNSLPKEEYVVREEFNGGSMSSRADLAVFAKHSLTFIEIKSDRDTFVRLENQLKDYDKYADNIYLILDVAHRDKMIKAKNSGKYPELDESRIYVYDNGTLTYLLRTSAKIKSFNAYSFHKGHQYKNLLPFLWSAEIKNLISFVKGRSKMEARKIVSKIYSHEEVAIVCKEVIFNRSFIMREEKIKNVKTFTGGTTEIQDKDLKQMIFNRHIERKTK